MTDTHKLATDIFDRSQEYLDDLPFDDKVYSELSAYKQQAANAAPALAQVVIEQAEEIERLTQWVNDLQAGMWINCAYCGHRYGPDDRIPVAMADVLKEHIEVCPKHPMSQLKVEIANLDTARRTWKANAKWSREQRLAQQAEIERLNALVEQLVWNSGDLHQFVDEIERLRSLLRQTAEFIKETDLDLCRWCGVTLSISAHAPDCPRQAALATIENELAHTQQRKEE